MSQEITHFLQFVKSIYNELPNHLNKIFEPRGGIKVKELSELNIDALLCETFTITSIQTEKKVPDGSQNISYSLIPKAVLSLKVLQELPIIVVLMYQLYKVKTVWALTVPAMCIRTSTSLVLVFIMSDVTGLQSSVNEVTRNNGMRRMKRTHW